MKPAVSKVYELNLSFEYLGERHMTGGSKGTLYASFELAQQAVPGTTWTKRERQRAWENERKDLIVERKVRNK